MRERYAGNPQANQPEIGEILGEQIREIAWSAHSSPRGRVGKFNNPPKTHRVI